MSAGRSAFIFFFYERPEKQVRIIRKYHNHTLQTKTRPDIIIHFIKQRDQFHFERKLYAQKCMSISVFFVPNFVVQHVNCFVIKTTRYKRKGPSCLWVMWHTMLVIVYASVIIRHLVTSPFKSTYFQIFWQKILSQNNRSYNREKLPNECKLIYAIYNFIVASWRQLFSYGSHLNTTTNLNGIFGDVNLAPIVIVIF